MSITTKECFIIISVHLKASYHKTIQPLTSQKLRQGLAALIKLSPQYVHVIDSIIHNTTNAVTHRSLTDGSDPNSYAMAKPKYTAYRISSAPIITHIIICF